MDTENSVDDLTGVHTVWGWRWVGVAEALWLLWLGKGRLQTFQLCFLRKQKTPPFTSTVKCLAGGVNLSMKRPAQTQVNLSLVVLPDVPIEQMKGWDICFRPAVVGNVTITSDEISASLWH